MTLYTKFITPSEECFLGFNFSAEYQLSAVGRNRYCAVCDPLHLAQCAALIDTLPTHLT